MADPDQSDPILPPEAERSIEAIGRTDLVVGIPSFNTGSTIGRVVTAAEVGLRKLFPDLRAAIVVSDGGSEDATLAAAIAAGVGDQTDRYLVPPATNVPEKVVFRYGGLSGKGSALRAVFEVVRRLDARACAVMDADLRSVTPYWLDRLLTPVVHHGYEFVTPMYVRHRHDGTITNSVAYPLTSALYGIRLRQPIGGEFAMTGELASHYADADVWETDVARFGIDLWMTTIALVEERRVAQSILGAKLHDPKDPAGSLAPMFRQVVGTCFWLAQEYADRWRQVDGIVTPTTFGFPADVAAQPVAVSVESMRERFESGRALWAADWTGILSPETAEHALAGDLDARAWVGVLYDYLTAWRGDADPGTLLDSLLPLYFARTAAFVERTMLATDAEVEAEIEALVDAALARKPDLLERWPAPAGAT